MGSFRERSGRWWLPRSASRLHVWLGFCCFCGFVWTTAARSGPCRMHRVCKPSHPQLSAAAVQNRALAVADHHHPQAPRTASDVEQRLLAEWMARDGAPQFYNMLLSWFSSGNAPTADPAATDPGERTDDSLPHSNSTCKQMPAALASGKKPCMHAIKRAACMHPTCACLARRPLAGGVLADAHA